MSAAKARPASSSKKSTTSSKARAAATGAAKSAAKSAAKGAARTAAKGAASGARAAGSRAVAASSDRIGRGTRWTEEQVTLLTEAVNASPTAKAAFEQVARELGKSAGTVAQKYYNLQKASGSGSTGGARRGRPAGSGAGSSRTTTTARRASGGSSLPSAADLRVLSVDDLVSLTTRVKDEVDRRRDELAAASKLLPG